MRTNFQPPFSERQLRAVAIIPKIAAFPAILGSLFIIQHVLRSKKRRSRVYHRILLLMSLHDFIYSIKSFISTWPIPEGSPYVHGAVGNTQTCVAAGFFGQAGSLTSIFYNGSLTVFFLLMVRYGWKEAYIKKRVEIWLHLVPITFGWCTAFAGLPLELYNAFGWTCWINSYPAGCTDNVDCERGDNAGIYRWAFFHAELWAIYGFTVVAMAMIYMTVRKQEKAMQRYKFTPSTIMSTPNVAPAASSRNSFRKEKKRKNLKKSNAFAIQATFYVVVFFFTWFFPMLQTVFSISRDELYYPLILLSSVLSSLQGFSNAIIYLRPRWIEYRKQNSELSCIQVLLLALGIGDLKTRTSSDFGSSPQRLGRLRWSRKSSDQQPSSRQLQKESSSSQDNDPEMPPISKNTVSEEEGSAAKLETDDAATNETDENNSNPEETEENKELAYLA